MFFGEKVAYHPLSPNGENSQRQEKLRRTKSQSLFFFVFILFITYIVLSVLLPDSSTWFSLYSDNNIVTTDNEIFSTYKPNIPTPPSTTTPKANKDDASQVPNLELETTVQTVQTSEIFNATVTTTTPSFRANDSLRDSVSKNVSESSDKLACIIPKLIPLDPSIKHLIKNPDPVNCTEEFPLLFQSFPNSTIVPFTEAISSEGFKACCFRIIFRKNSTSKNPDDDYRKSSTCYPMSIYNATTIEDPSQEYIAIYCKNSSVYEVMDMHVTVNLKPSVEERVNKYYNNLAKLKMQFKQSDSSSDDNEEAKKLMESERVNVVILGIDAVSHMNFLRSMPKSYNFLMNNLSAVEMQGFNKIGDNTFPNMAAVLTSLNTTQMAACEHKHAYDKCPFIWKQYAKNGFRTSYGEDSTWMGIFNYLKRGFENPPTDYYLRPFGEAADELIGTNKRLNAKLCHGPRLSFRGLLDYMEKMAFRMGFDKRYFQLIWATSLTHDYLNDAHFGDEHLYSSLRWFSQQGYLNETTVYVLMSDHGIRWGEIRNFLQGQLEERLPFLYFILPNWFKEKYSQAYENLMKNRNRLTTPYDLHETLNDLLDLNSINTDVLKKRTAKLEKLIVQRKVPKGISQFLTIPTSRTCEMAGVEEHYCTCHKSQVIANNHPLAVQAANYVVYFINLMVSKKTECAYLALETVKSAAVVSSGIKAKSAWKSFTVILETRPGGGIFEASVEKDKRGFWKVSGTISRTNLYGNQSHCVTDKQLKLYCYCLDMIKS